MCVMISARVGLGFFGEQLRRLHDLAGLAVAALRHFLGDPGLLQRVRGIRRQALDGDDLLAGDRAHIGLAGALRGAVDVDGAGAAQAGAAAVFGAGQSDVVADRPQQRGLRIGIDRDLPVVQGERDHDSSFLLGGPFTRDAGLQNGRTRVRAARLIFDRLFDAHRLDDAISLASGWVFHIGKN